VRVLKLRCHLDLTAESVNVETSAEIRWQDFYNDVATQLNFPGDEDARHSTGPQLLGDLVSVAESALETLRKVRHWFLFQASSSLRKVVLKRSLEL
jgi:hypothetical protein